VYRDSGGGLHAVSLTALESAEPGVDPQGKVASLLLPPPRPLSGGLELSAPLALLAVGLWLAGWAARLK
jgi:hypothetical protein